ncbi:hypothetical protein FEM03_03490 [Phragmitibacter flavus]|uniref:Uncharacterized protein n=1 Tax=Phragmitibacter flavus TaxID=2576071 RepID=A0A5R8KJK4_9BACT|nr:hypothetical protein [Phragmitibacter flavus]TLD72431.1 hypothetical protein FEM03_03490 [Phragmitibacter flavus]
MEDITESFPLSQDDGAIGDMPRVSIKDARSALSGILTRNPSVILRESNNLDVGVEVESLFEWILRSSSIPRQELERLLIKPFMVDLLQRLNSKYERNAAICLKRRQRKLAKSQRLETKANSDKAAVAQPASTRSIARKAPKKLSRKKQREIVVEESLRRRDMEGKDAKFISGLCGLSGVDLSERPGTTKKGGKPKRRSVPMVYTGFESKRSKH